MKAGFIGLGRMGANMVERLTAGGHTLVVYDRDPEAVRRVTARTGATGVQTLAELVEALEPPRVVWVMVPAGDATESVLATLKASLAPGDVVVDGGNSNFRDTLRRAASLADRGIQLVDAGTSGGVWGLRNGYCLMVGGPPEAYARVEPLLTTLAPPEGLLHTGPTGSGHFVKMVHNGIEYGMLAAIGEGFEVLAHAPFPLDLPAIAAVWNHGSVIRSWLLELLEAAYRDNPGLEGIRGYVEDSGEGRWTVAEALEENVFAPVITLALLSRIRSRQDESYGAKVVAALRRQFGGHAVRRTTP
ncbi:MAG: decarboxylating 6-phosphogluconate dehydrogenase [Actinomycetia bacterium]|nr:decarboxylating 6-phosphogluconate dehydrogenase [Actinomycetes bacterium]